MKGFKRCEKGHMYKDSEKECPYCPKGNKAPAGADDKTEFLGNTNGDSNENKFEKTEIFVESKPSVKSDSSKTKVLNNPTSSSSASNEQDLNKTFIQDVTGSDSSEPSSSRSTRKLMGWIVSYSSDPMGVDFKIFEGRNFLGSNSKADITISGDQSISGTHALILCKKNKFWLRDEMSSNGTYLNDNELEPNESPEIKDGDNIKIGATLFKFKSSH
tara:strand:- start:150 stop:797 length:648 start_codon:yes stop_codon:yes gene_type:complete